MISSAKADELSSAALFDKLKWMTSKEAAFYIRVSVGQLRNMVFRRQVRAYRIRNRLRFLRSDLDQLLKFTNKPMEVVYGNSSV